MRRPQGPRDGHLVVTAEAALSATAFDSGGIGFLELTAMGQPLRLAVSSCVGAWGPHIPLSNVHPPNTLPFHVAGLEHSLHCQGFPPGPVVTAQYLRQDALAQDLGG